MDRRKSRKIEEEHKIERLLEIEEVDENEVNCKIE
jgi:hypothetical protein